MKNFELISFFKTDTMKITGVILLIFAALNFIVAIIGVANGFEAAAQKFDAAILLGVIGSVLFFFGNKKSKKEDTQENIK